MRNERSREQLRQERETFEQARLQCARWFSLRLCMGYTGIGLMAIIALVAIWILLHTGSYAPTVISIAAAALLVDLFGLVASIFRLVLPQGSIDRLEPVTRHERRVPRAPIDN